MGWEPFPLSAQYARGSQIVFWLLCLFVLIIITSSQTLIFLNTEKLFYKTSNFYFHIYSFPIISPYQICCSSYKWKEDFSAISFSANSAWVRPKVKPHPLCLLKAAPVMEIWLLQLSQEFCWFSSREEPHLHITALMCLPLLQTESVEELSDRRYSTLIWKNMTLSGIFWWITYFIHIWVLGFWESWYGFGVVSAGWVDEVIDSHVEGPPSQYGLWHKSRDFKYRQNIRVRIILKVIIIVVTAANTRF